MTRKLIDTSVLVYAYESSDAKKHKIASELLERLQAEGGCAVSIQNLAEFSYVLSEKIKKPAPHEKVRSCVVHLASLFEVISYRPQTVIEALSISSSCKTHFFDALLAATMKENFISEIITENEKDFARIPGIKATNPFKR